jgi:poly(3-hydroxybutyrate) depolymerase
MRLKLAAAAAFATLIAGPALARDVGGVACTNPQPVRCDGDACSTSGALANLGNATDPKTGRKFWLDYPCDLKPGEKVTFILNIHGAGSVGNWQRHYFPASDYVQKHRLVVATPTAATTGTMGGSGPGVRMWQAAADDAHLQNITDFVFDAFGRSNVRSMWLAGHSQGGFTSSRIVCSDYFKGKVDGWLSLSGGRIGQAPFVAAFGPPKPDGSPPDPRPRGAIPGGGAPACDFSHIFEVGQWEIESLPATSPWAEKYGCAPRVREKDIVDTRAGYVWDYARAGYKVWGMKARPGTSEVFAYPKCQGGRVVADVVRIDKGHTEGLEPKVTEALVKTIIAAPGGKAQGGG